MPVHEQTAALWSPPDRSRLCEDEEVPEVLDNMHFQEAAFSPVLQVYLKFRAVKHCSTSI